MSLLNRKKSDIYAMCVGDGKGAFECVWEGRHREREREYISLSGCVRAIV